MTFVDHIVTGYRSVILSFGLVWNHRVLLVYPLLGYLIGSLIFPLGRLFWGLVFLVFIRFLINGL